MNCFPVFLSVHKMNTEFTFFTHVKAIHCFRKGHFVVQKEKEHFAVIEINNLVKNTGIIRLSIICHSLWNRGKFMVFWVQTVLANQQR